MKTILVVFTLILSLSCFSQRKIQAEIQIKENTQIIRIRYLGLKGDIIKSDLNYFTIENTNIDSLNTIPKDSLTPTVNSSPCIYFLFENGRILYEVFSYNLLNEKERNILWEASKLNESNNFSYWNGITHKRVKFSYPIKINPIVFDKKPKEFLINLIILNKENLNEEMVIECNGKIIYK